MTNNNIIRSSIALTIVIYTVGNSISTVTGNDACTTDNMRNFAVNACEMLMRHIRSSDDGLNDLPYHIVDSNKLNQSQVHNHHHSHHNKKRIPIRRHEFPDDGYLLVDQHLSKYLVRRELDQFSYNTVNGNNENNNDEPEIVSFVEYDNRVQHNRHKHRAHKHHPRFRRRNDDTQIQFCCRSPENCSITLC